MVSIINSVSKLWQTMNMNFTTPGGGAKTIVKHYTSETRRPDVGTPPSFLLHFRTVRNTPPHLVAAGWLGGLVAGWWIGWLGWLGWLAGWLAGLAGWLAEWLARLAGWLAGWLVDWLAGLAGWLVGWYGKLVSTNDC